MPERDQEQPALSTDSLRVGYKERTVLDGISLSFPKKTVSAVIGRSGCGKSTLLKTLAGVLKPTAGSVISSEEVTLMPQRDLLMPWRSVLDNVALPLTIKGESRSKARSEAARLLADLELLELKDQRPYELSVGMRQRIALLRTFISGRGVVLLDEPFANIDYLTRQQLQLWLLDICRRYDRTAVVVTHDIDEAVLLADTVHVLSGSPSQLAGTVKVDLPQPKTEKAVLDGRFTEARNRLLELLI